MTEGRGNHAVRSRDWRYIRYKDDTEELYDCKTDDPWNHTNLLAGEDRDKYDSVVAEHQKWLPETERLKESLATRVRIKNANNTMKASRILLALSLLASVCSAQEPKADVETPAKKMDVLFIAFDDMNDWTTLFDKNNPIQTPNLERLAARGAFFEKAYCASASCNPSRTATLTGLRPSTSGVYDNPHPGDKILPDAVTCQSILINTATARVARVRFFIMPEQARTIPPIRLSKSSSRCVAAPNRRSERALWQFRLGPGGGKADG